MRWCTEYINCNEKELAWHAPRKNGELSVTALQSGRTMVVAPSGAPVTVVYRGGLYMLLMSATPCTQESPDFELRVVVGGMASIKQLH